MAVHSNIKVSLACPHLTISSLLLIMSVVTFVGTFVMKYELVTLFGNYFEAYLEVPLLILIVGSVLVFIDACLGLISLAYKWYRGVITFLACTACLLVAMLALVALAYNHSNTEEEAMYSQLEGDLKDHKIKMDAIDTVQFGLKCCGYNNFSDWTKETGKNIPQSCCKESPSCDTNNSWEIHSTGCYQAINLFLDCRKWMVVVVLAVLGVIEIMAITLSVIVCRLFPTEINSKQPATDNSKEFNTALPGNPLEQSSLPSADNSREFITALPRNPLGQGSLPSVDNSRIPYVRRPTQLPAVLHYRSPHESFLRQPPQLRFDRRVILPSSNLKNPYAAHVG